jgi:hypothetical protein
LQESEQNEIVSPLMVDAAAAVLGSMLIPQTGSVAVADAVADAFMVNLLSTMQTQRGAGHYSSSSWRVERESERRNVEC